MCIKSVEVDPWQLYYVLDHFKTQEMCDKAVRDHFFCFEYVSGLLSGMMVIKDVRLRKQKLKKS